MRRLKWLPLAVALLLPASAPAVPPAADLYVSASAPARNFGAARALIVGRRPSRRAFLRFQLAAPPAPGSKVALYVYPLTTSRAGLVLRHASDRPWRERAITLRRGLPRTGPRAVRSGPLRARRWTAIDVTPLVTASGVVALSATSGDRRVALASRETGAHAAQVVVFGPGGAPVAEAPAQTAAQAGSASSSAPSSSTPPPPPAPPAPSPRPTPTQPCGVAAAAPRWDHVVWVVMENKSASQIVGSASAPYINWLAARCGSASSFYAETHPSLPNYIAMTSGSTQGIADDNPPSAHPLAVPSIFSQLGGDWRSLQESMPANCAQTSSGTYAVKHNPAAYYTNIAAACARQDVPLADPPDLSARFTFVTPNMCSDMHDCSIDAGDRWLATWMPKFLASPEYRAGRTAIFLTFDEDDRSAGNHIATLVVAPSTPAGTIDGTRFDHYAMLRTTEEMLGLPPVLGAAASAPSMRAAFRL